MEVPPRRFRLPRLPPHLHLQLHLHLHLHLRLHLYLHLHLACHELLFGVVPRLQQHQQPPAPAFLG
jgi:hypothetical protein